jgi:putative phosphoribosyl transferase
MNGKIHQLQEFRNQTYIFMNRSEAGKILGLMLRPEYEHIDEGMVLAIPSGGVPVGLRVKEILDLPFDLMIARKLQIPGNPEAGFGAMMLDGTVFYNERLLSELQLRPGQIDAEKERVGAELEKRNLLFRKGRPVPDLSGKRVILVDDGLASGFTMLASVAMAKKASARETIVAVPTAPQSTIDRIQSEVDKVYCANIRTTAYFAVAEAYRNWYDLSEAEVLKILNVPGAEG